MQGKQAKIVSPIQERAILGYLATTRYPARDRVILLLSMKALECFGLGGTLGLGLDGRGWRGHASPGPAEMQHDEEPYERQQSELVVQKV
jgi:hypothetical protein